MMAVCCRCQLPDLFNLAPDFIIQSIVPVQVGRPLQTAQALSIFPDFMALRAAGCCIEGIPDMATGALPH